MSEVGTSAVSAVPDVSVVMAVYNAMPYLTECLNSLLHQSIGLDRLEIVLVDDGSTDGSPAELDRLASLYRQLRVVHQANSGGPSQPRNRGLDLARGRYVFIADPDDYLGPEALERLVAMAEAQNSDVVVAKVVGVGRGSAPQAYRHAERVDLYTSEVYRSLLPMKLFRRSLIEEAGIRFPEDLWLGEDQIFVTEAFLAAQVISVVGDYDCYFLRALDGGTNLTSRRRAPNDRMLVFERVMPLVAERVTDPLGRRRMLARHFRSLIEKALLLSLIRDQDMADRAEVTARCRALCHSYWDESMAPELSALTRLQLYVLMTGNDQLLPELARYTAPGTPDLVLEGGRAYRRDFPYFRDPAARVPDAAYDVTDRLKIKQSVSVVCWSDGLLRIAGAAFIPMIDTRDMATRLVLRERGGDGERTVAVRHTATPQLTEKHGAGRHDYGLSGWEAELDLDHMGQDGALPDGVWDLHIQVEAQGVMRETRLAAPASLASRPQALHEHRESAVAYRTKGGKLSLDIGGTFHTVPTRAQVLEEFWTEGVLYLRGTGWMENAPGSPFQAQVFLRRRGDGHEVAVDTRFAPQQVVTPEPREALAFSAALDPLNVYAGAPLPGGVWDVFLRLAAPGLVQDGRLRAADTIDPRDLWRTHILTGSQGDLGFITPVVTAHNYAVIHSGEHHFTPGTQVLISQVGRGGADREVVVRGRIGLQNFQNGRLDLVLTESGGASHRAAVTPMSPSPTPTAQGTERNTDQWPSFSAVFGVGMQQLRRAGATARFELTVGGRSYESTMRIT
ncbi:glycosyltransferase [Streptomyces sp. NPDC051322]|uniref:glycosyltransferase family 2 protein n=1 Tax=Streptomyces sp. NPDC051322 TaxID=3154645 RepID=UPI00344C5D80